MFQGVLIWMNFRMKCWRNSRMVIGKAESIKYNSIKLQLNTPNTVLVFSNENPDKERMSKDRWIIYLIGVGVLLHSNGYKVEL